MKNLLNPMLMSDFYKQSHRNQYPVGTEKVYSTWTPRGTRMEGVDEVVLFGLQGFIKKYLVDYFNDNFFNKPLEKVRESFRRMLKYTLGGEPDLIHIEELHKLGYLPIKIKALKEGELVPTRVPCITIENTEPKFFWITNFLETLMSCELWQPITSATIAFEYRKIVEKYAKETVGNLNHVPFQCHDFSMRGMSSVESAMTSGAGHLLSFSGTDTIPAIAYLEEYYNADIEKELVGTSIPATEHSVMCSYGNVNEFELFKRLLTEVYPNGIFSAVSDTWDLWKVLTEYLPNLKDEVLGRDGKLVIRPDSGDPIKIICGDDSYAVGTPQNKGVIQLLWDTFGGTLNELGYKELNSHIGAIYGDSITLERAEQICKQLKENGFASSNIVFGVGSYTYQYNTRDTFCQAMKATYAVVNGEERLLFKDPVTDNGTKKSQRGLVAVVEAYGQPRLVDGLDRKAYDETYKNIDLLEVVFEDGKLLRDESLSEIREMLSKNL
jgi:nicotinamide phosphoribosyltransferase